MPTRRKNLAMQKKKVVVECFGQCKDSDSDDPWGGGYTFNHSVPQSPVCGSRERKLFRFFFRARPTWVCDYFAMIFLIRNFYARSSLIYLVRNFLDEKRDEAVGLERINVFDSSFSKKNYPFCVSPFHLRALREKNIRTRSTEFGLYVIQIQPRLSSYFFKFILYICLKKIPLKIQLHAIHSFAIVSPLIRCESRCAFPH